MTQLSPQAQAVLDAVRYEVEAECYSPWIAAAALRAAADQMTNYPSKKFLFSIADEMKLLAIAAELEGGND